MARSRCADPLLKVQEFVAHATLGKMHLGHLAHQRRVVGEKPRRQDAVELHRRMFS